MSNEPRPAGLPDYDEAEPNTDDGATSTMIVGGVDLKELQAAYAQHPTLAQWHETSIELIPEIYGLVKQGRAIATQQARRIKQLEVEVAGLKAKYEPEMNSPGSEGT